MPNQTSGCSRAFSRRNPFCALKAPRGFQARLDQPSDHRHHGSVLRLLTVGLLSVVVLALAPSVSAHSNVAAFRLYLSIIGDGKVRLGNGFVDRGVVTRCTISCPSSRPYIVKGNRATLSAAPGSGWRLLAWHGACGGRKPTCAIHLTGDVKLTVAFGSAVPGRTEAYPVPVGTAADIADGFRLKIVSVTRSAQLGTQPPAGAQYFAANVSATYTGGGQGDLATLYNNLFSIGTHNTSYTPSDNGCPNLGPAPHFPSSGQLLSGKTVSGNVCWTIASHDAASLDLFTGPGLAQRNWFSLR
jgi:hypothetical protein